MIFTPVCFKEIHFRRKFQFVPKKNCLYGASASYVSSLKGSYILHYRSLYGKTFFFVRLMEMSRL